MLNNTERKFESSESDIHKQEKKLQYKYKLDKSRSEIALEKWQLVPTVSENKHTQKLQQSNQHMREQ